MDKKIEAGTDNIRVRKSVETNDPSTVIIGFRISSQRDEPAAIQLRDPLPQGHEIHVQSGNDGEWTINEEAAMYECVLSPDETASIGYKSTAFEDQELDIFTTAPVLDVTAPPSDDVGTDEPPVEETDTFTRGASDAVFIFHGPETDTPGQPTSAGNTDEEKPSSKTHPVDEAEDKETNDSSADQSGPQTDREGALNSIDEFYAPGDEMGMADLVTDLAPSTDSEPDQSLETMTEPSVAEEGKASSDDTTRSTERSPEAFGGDVDIASPSEVQARIQRVDEAFLNEQPDHSSSSLEARVQFLQSRFHDLAAYIDAMEEFIDEHGDGEHVFTALSTDMERVQKRLNRLDDQQTAVQTNLGVIDDRVDTLDEREEGLDDEVSALAESLDRMEDVQQAVKEDVEALKSFHEKLQNAI